MTNLPDEYQKAIIESDEKDIVVLAGAGSGKTFTLLQKISYLVNEKQVDPSKILVLTFMRSVAEELKIKYIEESDNLSSIPTFRTFHGFCYDLLPDLYKELGYYRVPKIMSDIENRKMMDTAKIMSGCVLPFSDLENPDNLNKKKKLQYDNFIRSLDYICQKDCVISLDSLNRLVCSLFEKDTDSIKSVKDRYKYIFVDEFQDTDPYQFKFLMSMSESNRTVFGDALQNIYQFRGCTNKPIKKLTKSDEWSVHKLPINYRSTKNICDYVNNMSKDFKSKKYRIQLESNRSGDDVICLEGETKFAFDIDYMKAIIDTCRELDGSIAILCRYNHEVDSICKNLDTRFYSYTKDTSCRNSTYVGTIHSVKGLEYDNVIVINCGDFDISEESEENQNIFYTACTRAKNKLILFNYRFSPIRVY